MLSTYPSTATLAILRWQEGEMSLTIDALSQRACARRRTSPAPPARRHHTGRGPVCTTVSPARLAPRARPVTAARRAMGLSGDRHFTHDPRVLHRAPWAAHQASR